MTLRNTELSTPSGGFTVHVYYQDKGFESSTALFPLEFSTFFAMETFLGGRPLTSFLLNHSLKLVI